MLDLLRRIVQEVSAAKDLQHALDIIVLRVKEVMKTDVCSVYLTDYGHHFNVLMATDGLSPGIAGVVRMKLSEGLVGLVCERAEPVNLDNASTHERYKYLPETHEEKLHGFLGVPIVHHRHVLGALLVQQVNQRSFDENEVTLLMTIAAQLAGVIAHASAVGNIQQLQTNEFKGNQPVKGLSGAAGVAKGTGFVVYPPADLNAVPVRRTDDVAGEIVVFNNAVESVRKEMAILRQRVGNLPAESQALFDAYALMLQSDSLVKRTIERIEEGFLASTALRDTVQEQVRIFSEMEDEYLSERAQDIHDLGRRILVHIQSKSSGVPFNYPDHAVLVGDELSASALIEIPPHQLAAVVSRHGSGSSHVAILARALGVPAVMGAANLPIGEMDNKPLIVDGYQGCVYIEPTATIEKEYDRLIDEENELSADLASLRDLPAETPDGVRIPLYANSGLLSDVSASVNSGAEGIGLYRTEFPFMIRDRFPGEDEQTRIYRQILESIAPRPVTLRTLDIGGDKALSYFPIREENPFLGWRGIRVSLDHPDIFLTQIRAMLKASEGLDNLQILLPMITNISEVDEAQSLIQRARKEVIEEGHSNIMMPKIGAMIEVPAAVYQTAGIARRVDFLSIGTNDLVQYLLAVDRNNASVAELYDCLHPAVIEAVEHVVKNAALHNVPVSVCGEMAGDPAATILLLGMKMDSLSMSVVALPRIKWVIRKFPHKRAAALLDQAKAMDDAKSVRFMLTRELESVGLGGLTRAGK